MCVCVVCVVCVCSSTHRNCSTGEGRFQFITPQGRLIHAKVHTVAMAKATVQRKGSQVSQHVCLDGGGNGDVVMMVICGCGGGGGMVGEV